MLVKFVEHSPVSKPVMEPACKNWLAKTTLNQLGTLAEGLDKATTYEDLKRTKERPSGLSVGFRRTSVENPRKEYYAAAFVTTGEVDL